VAVTRHAPRTDEVVDRGRLSVLGMGVDAGTYDSATARIIGWARAAAVRPRYVCCANVHMTMEAYDSPEFRDVVNSADMVTSDGMPLVWMLRRLGMPAAEQVNGPTLTFEVCKAAAEHGIRVGFYGGSERTLEAMTNRFTSLLPALEIGYAYSPPYRTLSAEEDRQVVEDIVRSGVKVLFVGLGCPKQERWMAARKARLPIVQLGVGAAFDFHAGVVKRAPEWMQRRGLEWLFRLVAEPRRLWRRYLYHNPRFLALAALQLTGLKTFDASVGPR
jgi:N-acetylglucosaminyldiphosphoundecaprenol N-acetyl-beta-D-mannosaminyltransferase